METDKRTFTAVGVMSGTSVDGLDMALCRFTRVEQPPGEGEPGKGEAGSAGKPVSKYGKADSSSGKESNSYDKSGNSFDKEGNSFDKEGNSFDKEGSSSGKESSSPGKQSQFPNNSPKWSFEILKARSLSYSGTSWPQRLADAETADGYTLAEVHRDFGRFTGEAVRDFLDDSATTGTETVKGGSSDNTPGVHSAPQQGPSSGNTPGRLPEPDLIASHGHTIFHRPERGITLQIGDGAEIAAVTGITTVSDFRRLDVALGGQGAPLVPAGDELLFGHYGYCLNLGGFANVSFRESEKRVAFDICPVNIVMNRLARQIGMEYDKDGAVAASGSVDRELLKRLEGLDFYCIEGPRSLGKEWVDEVFMPVVDASVASVEDKLRTVCEHVALRIAAVISAKPGHGEIIDEEPHGPDAGATDQASGQDGPAARATDQASGQGGPATGATDQAHEQNESSRGRDEPAGGSVAYRGHEEYIETGHGAGGGGSLLITGGGAKNAFLARLISEKAAPVYTVIPPAELVDFKEAVIFAFLGVLRMLGEVNCLAAVTGASQDSSGGVVHLG